MIYKQCVLIIANNTATLDEDIYLYRLDKNVELYFTIVNNKYKFDKSDLNNIINATNASYFQMRLYKNAEVKYTFAIQPTDNGQAILKITDDLIDEPIELGDYDFQISLLDADKSSMISMPIVSKQLHVCEPLVTDSSGTGTAILGLSTLDSTGEIVDAFDEQGNYIRQIHVNGELISAELFNKWETALETNSTNISTLSSQFKNIANNFTTEQTDSSFIIKYGNKIIAEIPLNTTPSVYGNIIVDVTNLEIAEGGAGTFTVKLDQAPTKNQTINVTSSNEKVTVNPSTLIFTPSNYNTTQTVTITTTDDDLEEDYNANITLSNNNVDSVVVAIIVKDNDGISVVIPNKPEEVTPLSDFGTEYISGNPKLYLTSYIGTNPTVRVASTYTTSDGKTPTSYYYGLFKGNTTIENVFFDEGVQFHRNESYEGCTALKYVQKMFSNNLNRSFRNCTSLQSAPAFVETTDETALYTFEGCTSLQETPDMSKATTLRLLSSTFNGCTNLKRAVIPSQVIKLSNTFNGCTSLKNVTIQGSECEIDFNATPIFGNTGQEIKIKAPKSSNTIANLQTYIHNCNANYGNLNIYDLDNNELPCVSCWGDSLTKSPVGGVDTYPKTLLEKVGTNGVIYNFGVAGDYVDAIAQRQQSYPSRRNDIQIIWVGTNKDWDSNDDLISKINAMINYSTSNKYIIIGLLKRYASDELDNAMQSAFGEHFLNIRNYMITNGLTDASISATEQDNTDILNNTVPTSLMQDEIHLNATGQVLVGNQVYNKLVNLEYI